MFASPPDYESVDASQTGVGTVHADASEYSFFGATYRGVGAFAMSDATGEFTFLSANVFCMSFDGVTCAFLDVSASGFLPTGFTYAGVSSGGDTRMVCYSVGDQFGCQPF